MPNFTLSYLSVAVLVGQLSWMVDGALAGEQTAVAERKSELPRGASAETPIAERLKKLGAKVALNGQGSIQSIEAIGTGLSDADLVPIAKLSALGVTRDRWRKDHRSGTGNPKWVPDAYSIVLA